MAVNNADVWTRRIARLRSAMGLGQREFANEFGKKTSQSDISRWEKGGKELPEWARKVVEKLEGQVGEVRLSMEEDVHTPEFCYTATTFKRLWAESKKKISKMTVEAVIEPSRQSKGRGGMSGKFADALVTIRFEGIELPEDEFLYLDCFGVTPPLTRNGKLFSYDATEGTEFNWIGRPNTPNGRRLIGAVDEVPSVKQSVGPHALGYSLQNVGTEPVTISFEAIRGVRTDDIDGIGVPIYVDCPVESLNLAVTFKNLTPSPYPPIAKYWLLRRAIVDSRPLNLVGGLEVSSESETGLTFSFNNLRYPRPGFGYCIAWGGLDANIRNKPDHNI